MSYNLFSEDYLAHHGILGQKWGKRNGPPYPLGQSAHSASEKKAGWKKSLDKGTGGGYDTRKYRLTARQKRALIVAGATVAATILATYGRRNASSAFIISGAVSGALNPESDRAKEHAARYYESIRKMTTDCTRIAKNTGFSVEQIQSVKKYVFYDEHDLSGVIKRFDPDYDMASSWQRLIIGRDIQPHDITLLRHELLEMQLVQTGVSQDDAHVMASQMHNYAKGAREYHGKIKKHKQD